MGKLTRHYFVYRATCTNCSHVVKSESETKWLDPFFLPRECPGCGEYRSDRLFSDDYENVQVRFDWKEPSPIWWKPSTWFGHWVESYPQGRSALEGET